MCTNVHSARIHTQLKSHHPVLLHQLAPPFVDFTTSGIFDEEVVHASQPVTRSIYVTLDSGRVLEAVTWGSRAVWQDNRQGVQVTGFELEGRFVLADASALCTETGQRALTRPSPVEAMVPEYRCVSGVGGTSDRERRYLTVDDVWEGELSRHLSSLGIDETEPSTMSSPWSLTLTGAVLACSVALSAWAITILMRGSRSSGSFGYKYLCAASATDSRRKIDRV